MVASPATATTLNTQATGGLFALLVIDTKVVPAPSSLTTSSDGGGGGGAATGGAAVWGAAAEGAAAGASADGGAAAWVAAGRGAAAGGAVGSGVHHPVPMSEKLADHWVLVPVAPPGAVPGSPGPDTIIPTAEINAAAAMRTPGRRYHGGGGSA